MKIIRRLQVFVVLMLAFLCAGIGMKDIYAEEDNEYQKVRFNVGKVNENGVDLSEVKGLDWDVKNGVLTMDGYDGGTLGVYTVDNSKVSIDIIVKGENAIDINEGIGFGLVGVSVTFKGDGILNICGNKEDIGIGFYSHKNIDVTIDGPTINVLGGFQTTLYVDNFTMFSGTLNMDMYMFNIGRYSSVIFAHGKVDILGGTIIVDYKDKEGIKNVDPVILVYNHSESLDYPVADINNCAIIVAGDLSVTDKLQLLKYDSSKDTIKLGDNINFLKGDSLDKIKAIDIGKYKASLLETKFTYDGKVKTPEVNVIGLTENKDFIVKYINNIKPGTATAIITGKGFYGGEIKIDFVIEGKISEDGPKVGSKIKNSDYIYKVIKAGTTDGKETGEVALVGLNNKKLKKIKVAKTVSINNVKYKVTQIGAKAFKKNKKIKSVIIGKNVKKIGKQAFFGCKKLKKVTIKSKKLKKKSIGAKAFKGIYKKAKFKVPKKKLKLYKKLIKKAKAPKKCKISK